MSADAPVTAHRRFSLRQRVAWRLMLPVTIILSLNALWAYTSAIDAANRAYDRSLTASLKSIAETIHATGGRISVDIPYSALDIFESGAQERVYYAVVDAGGRSITGYDDLLPPASAAPSETPEVVDLVYRQQPIRLAFLTKRLYDPELAGGDAVTVLFAETTQARTRLAFSLFMESVRPQLLLIAMGLLLVVVVLNSAFRPLVELRDMIAQRNDDDLTPVSPNNVPAELLPLVDAINFHMARLARLLQARRQFLADAAHQMRTPLTVLGAQAEYGQRQSDPLETRRTFASLLATIRSTQRMANQMLTLARADPASSRLADFSQVDFAELVCDTAGELAMLAQKKAIDLSVDRPPTPILIDGNATMLREMVANLVDNALRYTPNHGQVVLQLACSDAEVTLRVVDDGPGIPPAEREKVFQRFYRILGHGDVGGSGLGLAIVREICWAHRGRITLGDGQNGNGLCVETVLPRSLERA